ncbi:MAG: hypothetical protein FWC03_07290 [Treponema sp.]|nr:hypothetical protein [Treponema sp.]
MSAIPGEYRKAAEHLFPRESFFRSSKPDLKPAAEFAKALGIGVEYQRVFALDKNSSELMTFLEHFENNLDLLIRKTWVEKCDEDRKDALQDKIPPLMILIKQGNFSKAIDEFGNILEELAYLLFGSQRDQKDFTEYTFRIDVQMGLFWWYGNKLACKELGEMNETLDNKVLWAVLLIGLCYLTNF